MKYRSVALFPLLFCALLAAQNSRSLGTNPMGDTFPSDSSRNNQVSLRGRVTTMAGRPAQNCRVEARTGSGGTIASTAYTNDNGNFDILSIPSGSYEVVAICGLAQAEERVDVTNGFDSVHLRLPNQDPQAQSAGDAASATVSVAQYRVPQKARDALLKAQECLAKSKIDDADKHIAEALRIWPQYSDALTLRAIRELDAQHSAPAIDDLDAAIKSDPGNARAHIVMAAAFNNEHRFDEAIRMSDIGISLDPDSWQAYFEMAKANSGKALYKEALIDIEKAARIAPKQFAAIHLLKANALIGEHDYAAATNELETFLQVSPKDPQAKTAQAMLSEVRGMAH